MALRVDHGLDAGRDVLLTLQNPNEPFAVWEEDEHWEQPRPPPPVPESEHLSGYRLVDPAWNETQQAEPVDQFYFEEDAPLAEEVPVDQFETFEDDEDDEDDAESEEVPVDQFETFEDDEDDEDDAESEEVPADQFAFEEDVALVEELPADQFETFEQDMPEVPVEPEVLVGMANLSMEQAPEASEIPETMGPSQMWSEGDEALVNNVPQVQFRLSSRHLISASSYFRAMLTGTWEENASRTESSYDISATGWDDDAFEILMNIIHGESQTVPRAISLELLAKMAVLVDYYKCHDVVRFFSDAWIERLKSEGGVTQEYCRDLVLWLFVSYVFVQPVTFRKLTFVAVQQTRGPLQTLGLPIHDSIIDEIEFRRQDAVQSILSNFHNLLEYFCTRDCCSFECSSILLGSLYKEMIAKDILSPRPAPPFLGFSIAEMSLMAREMQSPEWYDSSYGYRPSAHSCSLQHFVNPCIDEIEARLEGLELEDYAPNV